MALQRLSALGMTVAAGLLAACSGGSSVPANGVAASARDAYDWMLQAGDGPVPPGPGFRGDPAEYASAWAAKELCSRIFLAGEDPQPTIANELRVASLLAPGFFIDLASVTVDEDQRRVTVAHPAQRPRSAQHAASQGCVILPAFSEALFFTPRELAWRGAPASASWPLGEVVEPGDNPIDRDLLDAALDTHMLLPAPGTSQQAGARAVVVLHQGELVGERYADGYGPFTVQRSWSVNKSLTATLVGMMVDRGLLFLDAPVPVADWQADERARITLRHLVNMSSGIDQNVFEGTPRSLETFTPNNDHSFIYFDGFNTLKHAIETPLRIPPETEFEYRNGNVLIAAALAREAARQAGFDPHTVLQRWVFEPLGMRSSLQEHDPYGNAIASGVWFTTARDMARLGLLHINDGIFDDRRLLSREWVEFAQTPAPTTSEYGAYWWLEPEADCPLMPLDAYNAGGAFGQVILVIPSYELVIARLGVNFPEDLAGRCQLAVGAMQAVDAGRNSAGR